MKTKMMESISSTTC